MMEYPKKHWCLYLNKHPTLSSFDGTIGRQERILEDDFYEIVITDTLGYVGETKDHLIGSTINVEKEYLKLGYLPGESFQYLKAQIRDVNTRYIQGKKEIWYVSTVFGFFNTLDLMMEHDGVVNDELIELIASKVDRKVYLVGDVLHSYLMKEDVAYEALTMLEALKFYGVKTLEEVHEKTRSIATFI